MQLTWNDIRVRAAQFAREWTDAHYEKGETQSFYNDFFEVFGVKRRKVATFEERVKQLGARRGFIDLFWPGTLLVEQKSRGGALTKAKQQALDYFPGLKDQELPQFLLVCDFQNWELYDLENGQELKFKLAELPKHIRAFSFINGVKPRTFKDQDPVNIKASELMGRLHDGLRASGFEGHDLERFLVRLVFCLFADDTGIFQPKDIFQDYVTRKTSDDGSDTGPKLAKLFEVLNTPLERRSKKLDEDLAEFPYINGDLFAERLAMPDFDRGMRRLLLDACDFHWYAVSPAIFGSLFQSVMDKKKRRAEGAHYTTEGNILKVIHPLFLDDLHMEFERIKAYQPSRRDSALRAFHGRLASIKCFDPACGCGNFLVIAYRELRQLETETLLLLNAQRELDIAPLLKVNVDQFYGIELNEFPARIAEIALWMMDHIMNMRLSEQLGVYFARIPILSKPTIVVGDALELEWDAVLAADQCSYVLGNPPFSGSKQAEDKQRQQVQRLASLKGKKGSLDFVAGWYLKAGAYAQKGRATIGFVSTNSISQGEQVGELWPILFQRYGLEIIFAHRTFAWGSEARGKANVHCIIIGLAKNGQISSAKRLFEYPDIKGDPIELRVTAISAYLFDAGGLLDRNTVVHETSEPLSPRPKMVIGSKPIDGGFYIFTPSERAAFLEEEPGAAELFVPFIGSDEFINGEDRYLLRVSDASPTTIRSLPNVCAVIEQVRKFRLGKIKGKNGRELPDGGSTDSRRLADTPTRFHVTRFPRSPFLVVPEASSENRDYVPIGWLQPPTVPSSLVRIVVDATPCLFGILTSRMHMAWLGFIGGRLKSDFRYSIGLVYNPFPWPEMSEADERRVSELAQQVLSERAKHPTSSLAALYDRRSMPSTLHRIHRALDGTVDKLYRKEAFASDRQRVEFLLSVYEKKSSPLAVQGTKPKSHSAARRNGAVRNS